MNYTARLIPRPTVLSALAALILGFTIASTAQQADAPIHPGLQPPANNNDSAWEAQQKKEMAKKQNLERQQDIKKETDKLLELATELKQSVDKTTEDTLSLDVIKKAEQIEKLAKSVKEKMKGS
jgi:hypothetical protein